MKNESFTREYYVSMWASILSSYQWWGHDLITLLDNIKKTNPIVSEVFDKMYKENEGTYVLQTYDKITQFYQKLNALIPSAENLYTKLEVKSLKRKNDNISLKETTMLERIDYIIAVLCFTEEFALLSIKDKKVSSNENMLTAHSENIDIFIENNRKAGITVVRITIPCELCIEYYSSVNPLKWNMIWYNKHYHSLIQRTIINVSLFTYHN